MAYLEPDITPDRKPGLAIDIRGRAEPANLTELPFYRRRPGE
jgi:hypothetical protein